MLDKRASEAGTQLHYPCGTPPTPGEAVEVADGVFWSRMPLPQALAFINVWALRDARGTLTLVDTGIGDAASEAAWQTVLDGPLAGQRPARLIGTHQHPDHIGLAGWLARRFGMRVWMTRTEYLTCRMLASDTARAAPEEPLAFYRRAGWDEAALDLYRARFGSFGRLTSRMPDSYRRIEDGERIHIGEHVWEVVVGTGHTQEHACLYCPTLRLLISGDQVLPRISSNVSVSPTEPDANPLAGWLASLDTIRQRVPNDVLVLPAHNEPFFGLHERLTQLEASAERALTRLRAALTTPRRAIDVFGALFSRPIPFSNGSLLGLATGESVAYLNYLLHRKEAAIEVDEAGVAWYRMA